MTDFFLCYNNEVVCGLGASIGVGIVKRFTELQRLEVVGVPWLVGSAVCDILITVSLSIHLVGAFTVSLLWIVSKMLIMGAQYVIFDREITEQDLNTQMQSLTKFPVVRLLLLLSFEFLGFLLTMLHRILYHFTYVKSISDNFQRTINSRCRNCGFNYICCFGE